MLALFLAMRAGQLFLGLRLIVSGRGRGRRRVAETIATWSALAGVTLFVGMRGYRSNSFQQLTPALIDSLVSAGALVAQARTSPTEFDWTAGVAFTSAAAIGASITGVRAQFVAVSPLAAALTCVRIASGPGTRVSDVRIVHDVVSLYLAVVGIGTVARRLRETASEIELETEGAVANASLASKLEEAENARVGLHDGTLKSLLSIRQEWQSDRLSAQRIAAIEAIRVRTQLARGQGGGELAPIFLELDQLADEFTRSGVLIDLVTAEIEDNPADFARDALIDAIRMALNYVSQKGDSFVVRLSRRDQALLVTLRARNERSVEWGQALMMVNALVQPLGGMATIVGDRLELEYLI